MPYQQKGRKSTHILFLRPSPLKT